MAATTGIRTYFGIVVPPWKENKMQPGSLTLRFVLQDYVPSVKNRKSVWTERSEAKKLIKERLGGEGVITKKAAQQTALDAIFKVSSRIVGSEKYKQFVVRNKEKLQEQMKHYAEKYGDKGLIFPISQGRILTKYYFKSHYKVDTISKEEAVLDILTAANLITDDNRYVLADATRKGASYKDEILTDIVEILITIDLPKQK